MDDIVMMDYKEIVRIIFKPIAKKISPLILPRPWRHNSNVFLKGLSLQYVSV